MTEQISRNYFFLLWQIAFFIQMKEVVVSFDLKATIWFVGGARHLYLHIFGLFFTTSAANIPVLELNL